MTQNLAIDHPAPTFWFVGGSKCIQKSDIEKSVDQNSVKKWDFRDSRWIDRGEKPERLSLFGIMAIHRFQLCRENHSGRLRRGDIGRTAKRLIGRHLFLRISGGLSVNFEYVERIEYRIYLLNGILEKQSRLRWEGAMRLRGGETKERLSILRDRKSEFEKMTRFVIIESVLQKWIEWLWSTKLIAEILSIYLGVWERYRLDNYVSRFSSALSILSHFCESPVRGYTSSSRITFRNRYFILASFPPSPVEEIPKPKSAAI
jgi:hypothetical protein